MGTRYLADSNVLIDFLAGRLPLKGKQLLFEILDQGELVISVVTEIEVLGFQAPDDYLQNVQQLIDVSEIIPLADTAIIREAIAVIFLDVYFFHVPQNVLHRLAHCANDEVNVIGH